VLFVDDEPSMGDIARIFLEEKLGGCIVTHVADGEEALEQIRSHDYDAIVADYDMPGLNGLQLLRTVRSLGDNTPFLVCTGKSRHEVVIEALNAGADFYLQKGENPLVLFTEMKQMLVQAVTRRRSERALADSRKLLEEIIDFLPDGTLAIDASGRIIAWNKIMERLTGIPAQTVLFKHADFTPSYFRYPTIFLLIERILLLGEQTQKNPNDVNCENRIITEDFHGTIGEGRENERYYRIMVSPMLNAERQKVGFIGSVRDITLQKRYEYALVESRENFRALVENNTDIIMRFDTKGRHLYVNPAVSPYIPFDAEYLIGKSYSELAYPPKMAKEWDEIIQAVIRTGKPHEADISFQSPKGLVTLNWRLFPEFDLEGKIRSVLSISRDITYQREFEQEKQALLNQIERNLGEFAILNDGIRNPLAVITGWLSLMKISPKEHEKLMHQIKLIDEMITQLDRRWIESEKVLRFLRRHYALHLSLHSDARE